MLGSWHDNKEEGIIALQDNEEARSKDTSTISVGGRRAMANDRGHRGEGLPRGHQGFPALPRGRIPCRGPDKDELDALRAEL